MSAPRPAPSACRAPTFIGTVIERGDEAGAKVFSVFTTVREALDLLEAELWRRALKGVARPVFYGGKRCGVIRSYSDQLGMFLLKAHRPERYGQLAKSREEDEEDPDSRRYLLDLLETIRTRIALAEEEAARRLGCDGDEDG